MAKPRKTFCWMMKNASGVLIVSTASWTRKFCIQGVLDNLHNRYTWRQLYRMGRRIVRVECREIRKATP